MKILSIDRTKCSGCGLCQSVCSLVKKSRVQPSQARIRVRRTGGRDTEYVTFCQHCAEPVCVTACLKGIIDKDLRTGLVSRDTKGCFACAACSVMCPMDAIVHDTDQDIYVTCDTCGGDPECVKICPAGALRFCEASEASRSIRSRNGESLFIHKEVRP